MYKKLYSKLNMLGLTDKVKKLREIEEYVNIEEICTKYKMVIECESHENKTLVYFVMRHLYETEQNVVDSVNKMVTIYCKLMGEWSASDIRSTVMDIASDIEYQIDFNMNKFKYNSEELINEKVRLFNVVIKANVCGDLSEFDMKELGTDIAGVVDNETVKIEFKDSKLSKYMEVIKVISNTALLRGVMQNYNSTIWSYSPGARKKLKEYEEALEKDIILTKEDNIVEYKTLDNVTKENLERLGILNKFNSALR